MADHKITKEVYKQYANKIVSVLKNEDFYEQFKKRVDKGSSNFKLAKKRLIQDISIDWIDTIEEILPNLDTIVRNPRKFIVQEEDIVDVSLARSISTESVKFLAQHTNMISKVDKDGMVTPSKILNITKEESFEIYENRFIYTLLLKLKDFVTMRYDKIKKASATQDVLELDVESRFNLPSKKITFRTEYFAQLSFDEVMRLDPDTLTKIERIAKIDRIITDFLSSSFAKSMRNSAPVRPPIMRTNVILKEPNFKKALTLWQFIETYNVTGGFSTSDNVEDLELEQDSTNDLRNMVALNTMLFESMYDQFEEDMDMEDKEFGDFLRVGDMDFQKDELNRDEYAQKLDDKLENDKEEENVEEVSAQENAESDKKMDLEKEPEETAMPEKPDQREEMSQRQPEIEEREKEVEKEIIQEVEVEKPVEVERYKEMPPKADQEEVDLDPDAEKFDQHLYDVRKLYKRPDDDKLKQEDILKVKDAIDRCLTSYRRIKQEEIDDREREVRIRRRKSDMEKRAEAFRRMRAELEPTVDSSFDDKTYFGIDPFSYHRAKVAEAKKEEERIAERKRMLAEIERNKAEKLELESSDVEEIEQSIDEMERERAERMEMDENLERTLDEAEDALQRAEEAAESMNEAAEAEEAAEPNEEVSDGEEIANVEDTAESSDNVTEVAETEEAAEPSSEAAENTETSNAEESAEQINEVAETEELTEQSDEVAEVVETADVEETTEQSNEAAETEEVAESSSEAAEVADVEETAEQSSEAAEVAEAVEIPKVEETPEPTNEVAETADVGEVAKSSNEVAKKKSRRKKKIDIVDEKKVAVGGIKFKDGYGLPFGISFDATPKNQEHYMYNDVEQLGGNVNKLKPMEADEQPSEKQTAETSNEESTDNFVSEPFEYDEE